MFEKRLYVERFYCFSMFLISRRLNKKNMAVRQVYCTFSAVLWRDKCEKTELFFEAGSLI